MTYRNAVDWIARNDETAETELSALANLISVVMVADLTRRKPETVARDVFARRAEIGIAPPAEA